MASSQFRAPWWLRSCHLQTAWHRLIRPMPALQLDWERMTLPDGDFLDLAWDSTAGNGPVVILLHGLEGSIRSKYAAGMMVALSAAGFRPVVMHFRGCSGAPNLAPRTYHSGETSDFDFVLNTLRERWPSQRFGAIGYSLGGNVLLKWLGEQGAQAPLHAAAAVSVPFDLGRCAKRLERGASRLYQNNLLANMRGAYARKFPPGTSPLGEIDTRRLTTFHRFDDAITAPLNGFTNADDYYQRASSGPFITRIRRPTLIIHAKDDPFMVPDVVPDAASLPEDVEMDLSECGGHVGFVYGDHPLAPVYWLEERIPVWLLRRFGMQPQTSSRLSDQDGYAAA